MKWFKCLYTLGPAFLLLSVTLSVLCSLPLLYHDYLLLYYYSQEKK